MNKRNRGFTIIELTIMVMIFAGLMTALLNMHKTFISMMSSMEDKKKLETVNVAIKSYLLRNYTLPCPLNSNTKESLCSKDRKYQQSRRVLKGAVPWKDLDITASSTMDKKSQQFIYVVDSAFIDNFKSTMAKNSKIEILEDDDQNKIEKVVYLIAEKNNYKTKTEDKQQSNVSNYLSNLVNMNNESDSRNYSHNKKNNRVLFATKNQLIMELDLIDVGCHFLVKDEKENRNYKYMEYGSTIDDKKQSIVCDKYGKLTYRKKNKKDEKE